MTGLALLMTIAPAQAASLYICKPPVKGSGEDNAHAIAEKKARIDWHTNIINQYGAAYLKHRIVLSTGCSQHSEPRWRCHYRARGCKDRSKPSSSNVPVIKTPGIGTIR
jgi:hypothetical protein